MGIESRIYFPSAVTEEYEILTPMGRSDRWETYRISRREDEESFVLTVDRKFPGTARGRRATTEAFEKLRVVRHPAFPVLEKMGFIPSGGHYLVREFVRGVNLRNLGKHLDFPFLTDVLAKLLPPLHLLHMTGFVHGRISPEKIIVSNLEEGRSVHLVDLGLPAHPDRQRWSPPAYRAPEWNSGKSVDGRADLYSIAVLVYELMGGRHHYPLRNDNIVQRAELPASLVRQQSGNEGRTQKLDRLLTSLAGESPSERPECALQVARRLAVVTGKPPKEHELQTTYIVKANKWRIEVNETTQKTESRKNDCQDRNRTSSKDWTRNPKTNELVSLNTRKISNKTKTAKPEDRNLEEEIHSRRRGSNYLWLKTLHYTHKQTRQVQTMPKSEDQNADNNNEKAKTKLKEKQIKRWLRGFAVGPMDNKRIDLLALWMVERKDDDINALEKMLERLVIEDRYTYRIDWNKVVQLLQQDGPWAIEEPIDVLAARQLASKLRKACLPNYAAKVLENVAQRTEHRGIAAKATTQYRIADNYRADGEMNAAVTWFEVASTTSQAISAQLSGRIMLTCLLSRELSTDSRLREKNNTAEIESLTSANTSLNGTLVAIKIMQNRGDLNRANELLQALATATDTTKKPGEHWYPSLYRQCRCIHPPAARTSLAKLRICTAGIRQLILMGDTRRLLRLAVAAATNASLVGCLPTEAHLSNLLATAFLMNGKHREAKSAALRASKCARETGEVRQMTNAISNLMVAERWLKRTSASLAWSRIVLQRESSLGGLLGRSRMLMNCAEFANKALRFEDGLRLAHSALRLCRNARSSDANHIASVEPGVRTNIGISLYSLGRITSSIRILGRALKEYRGLRHENGIAVSTVILAKALIAARELCRAKEVIEDTRIYAPSVWERVRGEVRRHVVMLGAHDCVRAMPGGAALLNAVEDGTAVSRRFVEECTPDTAWRQDRAKLTPTMRTQEIVWRNLEDPQLEMCEALRRANGIARAGEILVGLRLMILIGMRAAAEGWTNGVSAVIGTIHHYCSPLSLRDRALLGCDGMMKSLSDLEECEKSMVGRLESGLRITEELFTEVTLFGKEVAAWRVHGKHSARVTGQFLRAVGSEKCIILRRPDSPDHDTCIAIDDCLITREKEVAVHEKLLFESPPSGYETWMSPCGSVVIHACCKTSMADVWIICGEHLTDAGSVACKTAPLGSALANNSWLGSRSATGNEEGPAGRSIRGRHTPMQRISLSSGCMAVASLTMSDVLKKVRALSGRGIPILLLGESGVGKELVARFAHECSGRGGGRFVTVDCPCLADGVMEAELFGHNKGAFTGAIESREGLLVSANGGTLFLDEIGDIHPRAQAKLLRALGCNEVRPVGAEHFTLVSFMLVSATNTDLLAMVEEGRFRRDLYHRLGVTLRIPPLRERLEEVPVLWRQFLLETVGKEIPYEPEIEDLLMQREWRGNVRELRNFAQACVAASDGEFIDKSTVLSCDGFGWKESRVVRIRAGSGDRAMEALEFVRRLGRVSRREYAKALHVSSRSALRDLTKLCAMGLLRRRGMGRSTVYCPEDAV